MGIAKRLQGSAELWVETRSINGGPSGSFGREADLPLGQGSNETTFLDVVGPAGLRVQEAVPKDAAVAEYDLLPNNITPNDRAES